MIMLQSILAKNTLVEGDRQVYEDLLISSA